MNIPDATATSILLTALLIVWELAKKKWSLFQPKIDIKADLKPVIDPIKSILDALEPIAKNAEDAAYAHKVRDKKGRPGDFRDFEFEEDVTDDLDKIIKSLERIKQLIKYPQARNESEPG